MHHRNIVAGALLALTGCAVEAEPENPSNTTPVNVTISNPLQTFSQSLGNGAGLKSQTVASAAVRSGFLDVTVEEPEGMFCGHAKRIAGMEDEEVVRGACLSHGLAPVLL